MMIRAALALAHRGLAVFPCYQNRKTPITKRGFKDATKDVEVIRAWWEGYPNANIAVATGEVSGVVVLDVDVKHDKNGEATLADLEQKYGALPPTVESVTPSKGRHLWFRWPGVPVQCNSNKLGPGFGYQR
jgi:putative DNA primase/helicase